MKRSRPAEVAREAEPSAARRRRESTPTAARARAVAALLGLLWASGAAAQQPSWEEIGPASLGGRVTALAVDPASATRLVVGTPAGGMWESTDGGLHWNPLTLWLASVPVSAVALHPLDRKRAMAGTGSVSDAGAVSGAIGLVRTTDHGATWTLNAANGSGPYVSTVIAWPGEPDRVLAGTDLGIRLSLDGGLTYAPVLEGEAVSTIAVDLTRTPRVVALAATRTGLFRTGDRGRTWAKVSAWPLLAADTFGAGTTALALSATTRDLLYATVQVLGTLNQTDRALLLRSTDGGQTFTELPPPPGFCPGAATCGFAHALAVDPSDDQRVLLGGEELLASTDGARTWRTVAGGLAGVHTAVVSGGRTYVAGRFGVAELDLGWTKATLRNTGLAVTEVVGLDTSKDLPPRLLVSTADSGTLLGAGLTPDWRVVFAPAEPVGPARFDPFVSSRLFASRPGGLLFRSDDDGGTFEAVQSGLDLEQSASDLAPLVPAPLVANRWYTGRLQVYTSANGADTWTVFRPAGFPEVGTIAPSPVVPGRVYFATRAGGSLYKADGTTTERLTVSDDPNLRINSIFPDPGAQNVLYVAATDTAQQAGRVLKSADFGVTWTDVTPEGLAPASSIVKDRFGALYVGARDGVWRSANDGFSWAPFRNGLFAGGVNTLGIAGGFIYAGTNGRGVFRTREQELVSIESVPPGLEFMVDGGLVTGPYLVHWEPGSVHTIAPVLRDAADTRMEFVAWNDGGSQTRTITATGGNAWFRAAIRRSFQLTATAAPVAGGTVAFAPASLDGFYPERSFVKVVPVPAPEYRFTEFGGEVSGSDGLLGYALMDRPRAVTASFEPLEMTIETDPAGLALSVDGQSVSTPVTRRWPAGSSHTVSAPGIVGAKNDPRVLAFDGWTDLRARAHTVTMARETFVTDLTARYVRTATGVSVPAAGARTLKTTGLSDAPRMAALAVSAAGAIQPSALQFLRGRVNGKTTTELALAPSTPRAWTHAYVEQDVDGAAGRARLALFNPGGVEATVGLLLRDASGHSLAAQVDAVKVPAGAHVTAMLDDLMQLPPSFKALLTVISDQPLVTCVHAMRSNFDRATFRLDPILLVPFGAGDEGVPSDQRVQVLLLTPETSHQLVVANTGFSALAGSIGFRDESGAAMTVTLPSGPAASVGYNLAPGAFLRLEFSASGPAGASLRSAQVLLTPSAGQPSPLVQLMELRTIGGADPSPLLLPRSVPPSAAGRTFRLPVDRSARETGAVLTNTSPWPVTLTLRGVDKEGVEVHRSSLVVPAGSQTVLRAEERLSGTDAAFQGVMEIAANIPLHGVGYLRVENERGDDIVAGFPLLGDGASAPTFPLALDGDSWSSEWWLVNGSPTALPSTLTFRGGQGRTVYFPME